LSRTIKKGISVDLPVAEQAVSQPEFPLRVAVADDDRSMRELLQHMLRKLGHEVVAVADRGEKRIDAEQKHVLMYLVKPISEANLQAALARGRARLGTQPAADQSAGELHADEFHSSQPDEPTVRSPGVPPYSQAIRPSQYTRHPI
jgi:hypothetical protein